MKLSSLVVLIAGAVTVTHADVTAPPKASLIFKEAPVRRTLASEPSSSHIRSQIEINDTDTEAGFCFICERAAVLKAKSLVEQSEDILNVTQREGTP